MKASLTLCAGALLCALSAAAQPTITGALNNASYALPGLPNALIAQGSVFAIFGSGLGPATLAQQPNYPLQKSLSGTSVKVTAGGKDYDALPIYTVATQVGALMPSAVPAGPAKLSVTSGGQSSAPFDITVTDHSPGIFTANQKGSGPAAALNSATFITPAAPVRAGGNVTIFGTGLGPISGDETLTPPTGSLPGVNVEVWVGGKRADEVNYAGRAPGLAGFDQINFIVPADVPPGCYVSLYVKVGNAVSNTASIPVAAGAGPCGDANGMTAADIESLTSKPNATIGSVFLSRFQPSVPLFGGAIIIPVALDGAAAGFSTYPANLLGAAMNPLRLPSAGSCLVNSFQGDATSGIPSDPFVMPGIDAGAITVSGPKGSQQLASPATGYYGTLLSGNTTADPIGKPFFEPGDATISNGTGGSAVKGFSTTFTVPNSPLTWINKDAISNINRGDDINVTWSGADPNSTVVIAGISTYQNAVGAAFFCSAPSAAGSFKVPGSITWALPVSTPEPGSGFKLNPGFMMVGTSTSKKFTAQGLDLGLASLIYLQGQVVNFK